MKTSSQDSVPSRAACRCLPRWRRAVAILLVALLSPVPALLAIWVDISGDLQPDVWVDPVSGHVFTLSELDAISDDIDGDGLTNWQELQLGTNPFSPDTDGDGISDLEDPLPLSTANLSPVNGIAWGPIAMDDADGDGIPNFSDQFPYGLGNVQAWDTDTDGDGIPDVIDPVPWDYSNYSPFNGIAWGPVALADADGDGVPNFHDWYPYDPGLWSPFQDADGDGLLNAKDPRPVDSSNPSPVNGLSWGNDVYGDADGDGIPNFYDAYPFDGSNGSTPMVMDADGDGIPDSSDPSPWDYYNYSAANGISWQWDALGDADGDGIANFYDQFPYDYYNGYVPASDIDGDGIPDAEDPAPYDPTNLSPVNGGMWYSAALADADGDGNPNFTDPWPYDPTNGYLLPPQWDIPTADNDGDGIPNAQDPALPDPVNFSIYNGTTWYGAAIGDIDGDGIINFRDQYPYDYYNGGYGGPDTDGDGLPDSRDPYPFDPYNNVDTDGDGIPDSIDPAKDDPNNLSPINGIEWYGDIRGDADGDGILNFWDLEPYGPTPVDTDGDGLIDSIDPAPDDPSNFSSYNRIAWTSDALGDADGDGIPNFFDAWPYDSLNGTGDADGDGLQDASDPAPNDYFNNSPYNHIGWDGRDVLGDADNDGILNYFDAWPYDPYNGLSPGGDADGDGIPNEQDPDPWSGTNASPFNGIVWGPNLFGDADGDGTANYWDSTPFGDDRDGDGIRDDLDPAPDDATNYSPYNNRAWYGDALGDNDFDGIQNFYDPDPDGGAPYVPYSGELPWASASSLVLLNDGYDELGAVPAPGVTPARDLDDEPLAIKAGPLYGSIDTKRLTALSLSLPAAYLEAGGSVTITQEGGEGSVRVHAVMTEGGVGVSEQQVALGSTFVPPSDGGWTYWVEGVTEGAVTLKCHFPQKTYGDTDYLHPWGAMDQDVDTSLGLMVCSAHLSVDRDRDGVISPGSYADTTLPGRPFRFWVNDDQDLGEAGDSGERDVDATYMTIHPNGPYGGTTTFLRANSQATDYIDGSRDLVDFFPVSLDIGQVLSVLPPDATTKYKLIHADSALNFTYSDLPRAHANDYLKKILDTGFGVSTSQAAKSATTWQITAGGVELSPEFLGRTDFGSGGVILVECRSETENPLVLVVEKDGIVVFELSVSLKICAVEQMYRHVDLTGLAKEYDGSAITPPFPPRATEMDNPSGLPDSETNDKYFVFVHGFNVDGQNARGWNAEVFKRLYVLGSRARFVGVTWNGTPPSLIQGQYLDYHKAVFQAFQAGDGLAGALGLSSPDVTVAAHSLGNMVVSHAIQSGGFQAKNYFMINAAVPVEAYVPTVSDQKGVGTAYERMTEDGWKGKDERLFASNWHRLFDKATDSRARLSWKGLFERVRRETSVTNFYSLGEDVVENPTSSSSYIVWDTLWDSSKGAWGHQEMIKGGAVLGALPFSRVQGGWGFEPYRTTEALIKLYPESATLMLQKTPLFLPFLEKDLFGENGAQIAADPKVRYDILARGIPSMSFAAAANALPDIKSFDVEDKGSIAGKWPTDGHDSDRRGRWIHSDFKNVALPYVQPMFQEMIARGGLSSK